jgi:uncharacterized damage-inducible protein DinB
MITRPKEVSSWLKHYISEVNEDSLIEGLKKQTQETLELLNSLSDEQLNYRYAEGKWTIREIMVHLIDSERVFSYRALRFSRKDNTELPGYDQDLFVANSCSNERSLKSLLEEYIVVRTANVALFSNLTDAMLDFRGRANGNEMSARELGFATLGHEMHHIRVIRERYL